MTTSILPSTLRPFPSLQSLPDADLAALSRMLHSTQFRTGAQICREGDVGDTCYFLVEGDVEVTTQLGDGRRIFLARLEPGTVFGKGALVAGQLRNADVRAASNVRVLALGRLDHQWALEQGASWAIHLQRSLCVDVIRQLRTAIGRLRALADGEELSLVPEQAPVETERKKLPAGDKRDSGGSLAAPRLQSHDASTTGRLLTLIAETEASLADEGVDLAQVRFVVDSDSERRSHKRKG
jgi:CRP/FNR family cyclic AMP-dependent transcriptional regulator